MHRDDLLVQIRPVIASAKVSDIMSLEERFQNEIIRPLLILQHDIIITMFKAYLNRHNKKITHTQPASKITLITGIINKDITLRNQMIGAIIGLFSLDELDVYYARENNIRKRIADMLVHRIASSF